MTMQNFDQMTGKIWLDGHWVPWQDAKLHVLSHGLHYASSVFEGLRAYDGCLFQPQAHFQRFVRSAELLGFKLPYDVPTLCHVAEELVTMTPCAHLYMRPVAWCGSKIMTVGYHDPDVHVAIAGWERPPTAITPEGVRLTTAGWRRPHPSTAPVHSKAAGLYMISSLAKNQATQEGFDDALMLDDQGFVAEATSANVFLVHQNILITPAPTSFLDGITRQVCIALAQQIGLPVQVRHQIPWADMQAATEVFLTGTAVEILPVQSWQAPDGSTVSYHQRTVTSALQQVFTQATKGQREVVL